MGVLGACGEQDILEVSLEEKKRLDLRLICHVDENCRILYGQKVINVFIHSNLGLCI